MTIKITCGRCGKPCRWEVAKIPHLETIQLTAQCDCTSDRSRIDPDFDFEFVAFDTAQEEA